MTIRKKLLLFAGVISLPLITIIIVLVRILYYRLQISHPPADPHESVFGIIVGNYAAFLFIIIVAALIATIVLGVKIFHAMIGPVNELKQVVQRMSDGNVKTPIYYSKEDEFSPVFEQIDQMRIRLYDSITQQVTQEKERQEMIASITHDLKTPITSIRGYAEGLLDGIAEKPEKRRKYLQIIIEKASDLNKMAETIKDFSRLEVNQLPIDAKSYAAKSLLYDIIQETACYKEHIETSTDFSQINSQTFIRIDPSQTRRVIGNIIENSIRYRKGNIAKVDITGYENEKRVILCFADFGQGIKEKDIEKIFERFYRSDEARRNSGEGSGLGLSICKQIQQAQKGDIWARENPEGGLFMYLSFFKQ